MLDALRYDTHHAARALGRRPGFTAIALLSLAVGLGATATMFSIVDALDLRALPYRDADRIMYVRLHRPKDAKECAGCPRATPSFVVDLERTIGVFQALSAYTAEPYWFDIGTEATAILGADVTPDHFAALGIHPFLGRVIESSDTLAGAERVAVASETFWRTHLDADRNAIGKGITLRSDRTNGAPRFVRIIGVMPGSADLPEKTDLW